MLIFALFIAFSPLFIAAAPLPRCNHLTEADSNPHSTLYRRAPPKFEIPQGLVVKSQRKDTLDKMMKHYDTEATDAQKRARLACAASRWNTMRGRDCLKFNYHAGDTRDSPVIGSKAEIFREKLVPKIHFETVKQAHQEDMTTEGMKLYNSLGDERIKSMKAWGNWDPKGGIREKTQLSFHYTTRPTTNDMLGAPVTVQRPLTLRMGNVPSTDRESIENDVRAAHRRIIADEQHPASKSNFGTVYSGWHDSLPDADGKTHKQVFVGLDEVSKDEKEKAHLGYYPVRKGSSDHESPGSNTGSSTLHGGPSGLNNEIPRPSVGQDQLSTNALRTGLSSARPSRLNNEVPRPSISQEHRYLTAGSPPMNALPSNTGWLHLNSQGMSAGSPLAHPEPSHPQSSHSVSPHQTLQPRTDTPPDHNKFDIASPDLSLPRVPIHNHRAIHGI